MNVALFASSANHCPVEGACLELRRNGQAALLAGDGVPHDDPFLKPDLGEDEAVVAIEEIVTEGAAAAYKVEAPRTYAVGTIQDGIELELVPPVFPPREEAEEGRLPVVCIELAEEPGVGDEASPALADGGGAPEGGGQRREAEEDLPEYVVAVRQGGRLRR
jgi:hypothetical protein